MAASPADGLATALEAFATASTRQLIAAAAAHDSLTPNDVLALAHLRAAGELGPGALARRLLLTEGGTAGVVRRLRAAGLVEREVDPSDRRDVRLRLTAAGHALLRADAEERDAEVARAAERLAPQARAELAALLLALAAVADARADVLAGAAARAADPGRAVPDPGLWG
ncbi:MAG TPA: MarR family winged helix-turn-helix transcriptional regulator [Baekduia sp.]